MDEDASLSPKDEQRKTELLNQVLNANRQRNDSEIKPKCTSGMDFLSYHNAHHWLKEWQEDYCQNSIGKGELIVPIGNNSAPQTQSSAG